LRVVRCAERLALDEKLRAEALKAENGFVTRHGLAALLKVSVRTVDEMVAAKEISPVRLHGPLVRFYMPDVIRELTAAAGAGTTGLRTTDYETGKPRKTRNMRKEDSR
jgi:excisionase family DNA binding protein